MPENTSGVSQDQCETRRYHCGEAMAKSFDKLDTQFGGFLTRIEQKIDPLVTKTTEADARSKSNKHRLNWLYGIISAIIVGVIALLIKMILSGGS
jgi:hypothetical protein